MFFSKLRPRNTKQCPILAIFTATRRVFSLNWNTTWVSLISFMCVQAPAPRAQGSLLGLDKLAAQQRADKLAALEIAVDGARSKGSNVSSSRQAALSFGEGQDGTDGEEVDDGWPKSDPKNGGDGSGEERRKESRSESRS